MLPRLTSCISFTLPQFTLPFTFSDLKSKWRKYHQFLLRVAPNMQHYAHYQTLLCFCFYHHYYYYLRFPPASEHRTLSLSLSPAAVQRKLISASFLRPTISFFQSLPVTISEGWDVDQVVNCGLCLVAQLPPHHNSS